MSRPSRQAVLGDGGCSVHLTIRAHNQQFLFHGDRIKHSIYNLLLFHKNAHYIKIYHYCFLDNHIHLVLYVTCTTELSRFMQKVFGSLAKLINKREQRSGRVFGERAKTPVIQNRNHFLRVMRYVDLNPVRASIVRKAHHYAWSSYRHYAYGESDALIDEAPEYQALAKNCVHRRKYYRKLVNQLAHLGTNRIPEMTSWLFIGDREWVIMMCVRRGLMHTKKPPS